jgi:hypothetical protein
LGRAFDAAPSGASFSVPITIAGSASPFTSRCNKRIFVVKGMALRAVRLFAASIPSLLVHIPHIVSLCANPQMIETNATGVVAFVHYDKTRQV